MLPRIIQTCKFEWKCAVCIVSLLSVSLQIENIDACLSFLAAKGVNIQGLSAEGRLTCTLYFFWNKSCSPETNLDLAFY